MASKNIIGQRIRTMRLSRGMTQADLARAINQSQSSITMYETGRREPDFETLEAFADIFNVPLAALMGSDTPDPADIDPEIHIVSGMMETMTKEQKQQVIDLVRILMKK